jgi:hypothetical protein
MSQEKVREILSHVDMTKIDLSSFRLSEKKFDELSHLYRNRALLSCMSVIIHKEHYTQEEIEHALTMVQKIANDPDFYSYSHIYSSERKSVDDAINDITTRRDRSINDVKIKAIEKRIKDAYKSMRKTIEAALANGNTFEDELDENIVERCLQITKNAIASGYQKAAEEHEKAVLAETVVKSDTSINNAECEESDEAIVNEQPKEVVPTKVSFWKRVFCKAS